MRIGFCCKLLDANGVTMPHANTKSTTVAWLKRQSRDVAEQRLWDIMEHNISSVRELVTAVGNMDERLRMVRIGSDVLPVYTEPTYGSFYDQTDVIAYCEKGFAGVGELAREMDVRLSFHPGQFCVLASADDGIVDRSIEEFEYHVDMARWMGYGKTWHDHGFKINVHISGRRGPQGILDVLPRLSPEARNLITIENDENGHGLEDILKLEEHVALVPDIHHHWVRNAEYIDVQDDRIQRAIRSWRGVRPVLHYSVSREDVLIGHDPAILPDMQSLQKNGHKRQKLRAHSDFYWNSAVNDWAFRFLNSFDIQCESKAKNLASRRLFETWKDHINNHTLCENHACERKTSP